MSYDLAKFKHGLEELRITLTDHQIEQFLQYYEMLVEKNKVMNSPVLRNMKKSFRNIFWTASL